MLDLITSNARFVKSFRVLLYEQEGKLFRFKAELIFVNNSKLFIKDYFFENMERKYSYHWSDLSDRLICRWDNANHWPHIPTFPHHKHTPDGIFESTETSFGDVLTIICRKLENGLS